MRKVGVAGGGVVVGCDMMVVGLEVSMLARTTDNESKDLKLGYSRLRVASCV